MTLQSAVKAKNINEIRKITRNTPIADLASLIKQFTPQDRVLYFRLLKTNVQSKIFIALDLHTQQQIVEDFTDIETKEIISSLYADDLADLIEEVPPVLAARILSLVTDKETKENVNKILRYHDDQIGSIMTVDIVLLKQNLTVKGALDLIRQNKNKARIGHYFFIVDFKQRLVGFIALEDLVFASETRQIKKLAKPVTFNLRTTTNIEEAANVFAQQDMSILPVLNGQKQVMGSIFSDDVIDIIQESASEDFRKLAAVTGDDDKPYSEQSIFYNYRSRIIWLLILMLSSTVASIFLEIFQTMSTIKLGTALSSALVVIMPVVMDAAGNAGTQSSTLIVRGLATGDIQPKQYWKTIRKEAIISLLIGFSLGVFNFIRLIVYYSIRGTLMEEGFIILAMSSSISLLLIIFVAKTVGAIIPLLAKKVHLDPAILSGPLITTVIDAVATLSLFGVSIWILIATGIVV